MNGLYQWFVELHQAQPYLLKALLAGTLVSTTCGIVGCFIILRRTAFLADALAHSMLAGVVCGYLFMKVLFNVDASGPAMLVGSVVAGFLTVLMVGFVSRFSRIKEDAVIGIMYTGIFALGGVLLSLFSRYVHVDLVHFVTGQLLVINDSDLWMMAGVSSLILSVIVLFFRQLQLISFDRVMAASLGIPVLALDYLLTTCTSLIVVAGVRIVGVILVVGLLIIPASTAYLLCNRLTRMLPLAGLFGWTSFVIGYFFSVAINVAPGSAVVLACAIQFLIVLLLAPNYGLLADWMRKRRSVPQQVVEDVLSAVLKAPGSHVPLKTVLGHVSARHPDLIRSIRELERRDLLEVKEGELLLTVTGEREARRLIRAHRLWESYLAEVGTPAELLHDRAHQLEHVNDEAAVDYLDDKLGHPLTDPHGSEIPEDFVHLVPGTEVSAALLREGHRGTITSIGPAAAHTVLQPGMTITTGPRETGQNLWTLLLPTGQAVTLDHTAADAVKVLLEATGEAQR